ncbi:MAG: hypothetical protein ABI574_13235 [Burkholderiales bacterium]
MNNYIVTEVGWNRGQATKVEAHNDTYAVAQVAGCTVFEVCVPIRCEKPKHWSVHPTSGRPIQKAFWQEYEERYYMPRDDSGRQWMVTDASA